MPAPATPPLPRYGWTADTLLALPSDGNRYECVDGELFVSPAPSPLHQRVLPAFYDALKPYVATHRLGEVLWSPADIVLDAATLVQPDLFVAPPGLPVTASWADVRDLRLVLEVLSPSTARADRRVKRARYQRAGIPQYWIVDPWARLVEVWQPETLTPMQHADRLAWHPDGAPVPLVLDLPAVFAAALGPEAPPA